MLLTDAAEQAGDVVDGASGEVGHLFAFALGVDAGERGAADEEADAWALESIISWSQFIVFERAVFLCRSGVLARGRKVGVAAATDAAHCGEALARIFASGLQVDGDPATCEALSARSGVRA